MSSRSIARWGAVLAAPVLAVSAGLSPASATATYTVPLHQAKDLPITAAGFDGEHKKNCADIPVTQDGWHFVLPTNSTDFVKLTVTFEPGGTVVVNKFGPPDDKHAYVASAPGAKLVSASAEVMGGEVSWFNLSHTCPASEKPPTTPPTTQPPTTAPPTTKPATTPPATGGTTPPPSGTPSATPSASESATVSPTSSPSASTGGSSGGGGSLAQTGGIAVGGILAVSAALVVGGYYIRRRTAGGNTSA